jgi:small subunit ribosomal protein S35
MSCESFETQAQNKRFLGDTIGKLLAEARDPNADSFEDVPLDLRHVENKRMQRKQKALLRARLGNPNTGFPVEWRMTAERRAELDAKRNAALEAPAVKQIAAEGVEGEAQVQAAEEKKVVSGIEAIEAARKIADLQRAEAPLMAEARAPLAKGKQGKKEFGQSGRARR